MGGKTKRKIKIRKRTAGTVDGGVGVLEALFDELLHGLGDDVRGNVPQGELLQLLAEPQQILAHHAQALHHIPHLAGALLRAPHPQHDTT